MLLGVPTLYCYDLLLRLIRSAEAGTEKPGGYRIIDNGGGFIEYARKKRSAPLPQNTEITVSGKNLGVAASWNLLLSMAHLTPMMIVNDDIELLPDTYAALNRLMRNGAPLAHTGSWSCFAQSPALGDKIGLYDTEFSPAYFEDSDYAYRMKLAGVEPVLSSVGVVPRPGSATILRMKHMEREKFAESFRRNQQRYINKWGGLPHEETFTVPFNGDPELEIAALEPVKRYDIVNECLRRVNDTGVYIEVGVSNGDCIKRIHARLKIGVDPDAQASTFANLFHAGPSDTFWATCAHKADVVFIDGLHTAEQVLRDIDGALSVLSPRGVIVLHDCNPPSEAAQIVPAIQGEWTGDVWKAIATTRAKRPELHTFVVDTDYGVGVIVPGREPAEPLLAELPDQLTYAALDANRKALLGLVNAGVWKAHLDLALS
jgi:hypothetical protein